MPLSDPRRVATSNSAWMDLDLARFDFGQVEKVVHHVRQLSGRVMNERDLFFLLLA